MIDPKDESALVQFFDSLSMAMNSVDEENLLPYYHVPSVFVSNEEKTVCSSEEKVRERLHRLFDNCHHSQGIDHQAKVVHCMSLSDSILFAKIDWQVTNNQNEQKNVCSTSYTLERGGKHGFDIIVSVISEEEVILDQFRAQMES